MRHQARPIGASDRLHRYSAAGEYGRESNVDLTDVLRGQSDQLLESGDVRLALERAFRWGYLDADGEQRQGLMQLLQELKSRRDRLARAAEHDTFLDGLREELDRIDQMERSASENASSSRVDSEEDVEQSVIDRIVDRLEQGYASDDAQQEFSKMLGKLSSFGGDSDGGSSEGAHGQLAMSQSAERRAGMQAGQGSAERIASMLFSGGTATAGGGQRTRERSSDDDLRRRLQPDLLVLEELARLDRAIEELGELGSVAALPDMVLNELLQHLSKDDADWLQSWEREIRQLQARSSNGAGHGRVDLPPDVARAIGADILRGLFKVVASPMSGDHRSEQAGNAGDSASETRQWQPGDALDLNLVSTVFNAVKRDPGAVASSGVRLHADDFDVLQRSSAISLSTVLAIDRSRSMGQSGGWASAKRIALALHELIRRSYPRDSLDVLAFSAGAELVKIEDVPTLQWDQYEHGTNVQHALSLSRMALRNRRGGTRQIVLVTDGEPTIASVKNEEVFASPPNAQVLDATMREVARCTREGIIINLVLLAESEAMHGFVHMLARHNKGRVFRAQPGHLGVSLLKDYVAR